MRSHSVAVVLGLTLVAAVTAAAPAASEPQLAAGSLDFQASFGLVTDPAPCPRACHRRRPNVAHASAVDSSEGSGSSP
jgi:hypothetical protein